MLHLPRWIALAGIAVAVVSACSGAPAKSARDAEGLTVLWTSGDPEVAHKVAFMYVHNAKRAGWFADVSLIIWGPSARLLAADESLQADVRAMLEDGVRVQACAVCARLYGVVDALQGLGIRVEPMGEVLTGALKSGRPLLTF